MTRNVAGCDTEKQHDVNKDPEKHKNPICKQIFHLKPYGGTFLLKCNYEFKDLTTLLNGFYSDLLLWWEEFRNTFSDINYAQRLIWNNKEIRIDNRSVFYKLYYENGIVYVRD